MSGSALGPIIVAVSFGLVIALMIALSLTEWRDERKKRGGKPKETKPRKAA